MDRLEFNGDIRSCRICLDQRGLLDWNEEITEFIDITYRDCYYKYTQLDDNVTDIFPQTLCENCSNDLRSAFHLIQKALQTNEILQQTLLKGTNKEKHDSSDFETLYIQSTEIVEDDHENKDIEIEENGNSDPQNVKLVYDQIYSEVIVTTIVETNNSSRTDKDHNFKEDLDKIMDTLQLAEDKSKPKSHNKNSTKTSKTYEDLNFLEESEEITDLSATKNSEPKLKSTSCSKNSKKTSTNKVLNFTENEEGIKDAPESSNSLLPNDKSMMSCGKKPRKNIVCSYCSKLINKHRIKAHERTHKEHRERSHVCSECGIKLFNKSALNMHILTHKENREKKHKCEFCEKAYYNRGALNVHRRIHLGQMIPCTLCSKEYCRQIDLDKHMSSHSVTPWNGKAAAKIKYQVECKECGKMVNSVDFKEHQAIHMNKPVIRCNICQKDFFSLSNGSRHMRKVHRKTRHECTTYYTENKGRRLAHLWLKQQEKVETIAD